METVQYLLTVDQAETLIAQLVESLRRDMSSQPKATKEGRNRYKRLKQQCNKYEAALNVCQIATSVDFLHRQLELVEKKLMRIRAEFEVYINHEFPSLESDTPQYKKLWKDHKNKYKHGVIWKQLTTINWILKLMEDSTIINN